MDYLGEMKRCILFFLFLGISIYSTAQMKQHIKTYTLDIPIERAQEIFTDITIYADYHPLIISATLQENINSSNPIYLIKEKPFNGLPFKVKYVAEVKVDENNIEYIISKVPMATPHIIYTFKAIDSQKTKVEFNLQVKGFFLVKSILFNKMKKAQDQLMQQIKLKSN